MSGMEITQADRCYLIRKGGYWYRPNSQGYTANPDEAGRYTLAEAESITHPNGRDGPRDGLDFVHENEAPVRQSATAPLIAALEEAREALFGLAMEAGDLVIATDGQEELLEKRRLVLEAVKLVEVVFPRITAELAKHTAQGE